MATTSSSTTLKDTLVYLKKKLDRTTDENAIVQIIYKMSKIPITIELLQGTGAGKIMRVLAKKPGSVGAKASSVLNKWRDVVANSQKSNETLVNGNDHLKTKIHHTSSKMHHKSEKETKKHEKHSDDKHTKHKFSIKEKYREKNYEDKHKNSEQSKERIKMTSEEKRHYKEKTKSKSFLNNVSECETKRTQAKEKYEKLNHIFEYSKHSNKLNGESSTGKKNVDNNKFNSSSKRDRNEFSSPSDSDSVHNSDSSVSYELPTKKPKISEMPLMVEFQTKKSSKSSHSDKNRKNSSELGISPKKTHIKESVSSTKNSSREETKKEKTNNKSKTNKTVKKDFKMLSTEEFTSSEATFEDCLSFNDIVPLKKKKNSKPINVSHSKVVKKSFENVENDNKPKNLNGSSLIPREKDNKNWKVPEEKTEKYISPEKKEVDIASTLPQTQPNYRPLPQRNYDCSPIKKRENMTNEDAIKFTSSRKEKTAVYSGRRNKCNYLTEVPTLFESCTRVLIENLDNIEYMGEIPYFLLEPVLQRCSPTQLYRIEDFNPYLLAETDQLWEVHCKREYRTSNPQESETWRELYWRSHDEREQRLKSVTANISALIANSNPTRKAKLAYVDSVVKPPRDVARKQAKHGTGLPVNHSVKAGPPSKASARPTAPHVNSVASTSRMRVEAKPIKPKIAPLMAKTLKSMKKCFRR